jgi:hypothetical protein
MEQEMTARYQIIECEQGSPEWREARRGLPTASRYGDVLAQGQGKMRNRYRRQLAAEIVSGKVMKTYSNAHMERGKEEEDEILMKYAFDTDAKLQKVGFLRYMLMPTGCSPDGLIGNDGMVETRVRSTTKGYLRSGEIAGFKHSGGRKLFRIENGYLIRSNR